MHCDYINEMLFYTFLWEIIVSLFLYLDIRPTYAWLKNNFRWFIISTYFIQLSHCNFFTRLDEKFEIYEFSCLIWVSEVSPTLNNVTWSGRCGTVTDWSGFEMLGSYLLEIVDRGELSPLEELSPLGEMLWSVQVCWFTLTIELPISVTTTCFKVL